MECPHCGSSDTVTLEQVIADGRTQLRLECNNCGKFIKFAKRGEKSLRERMLDVLYGLEHASRLDQFTGLKERAREILNEIGR